MRRLAPLLVIAAFTGAGAIGCVKDPAIRIDHARISSVDSTGVTVTMTMNVKNDNSFDVLVRDVRANVILDNVHFLPPIRTSPNIWLPSKQTTPLLIPVLVPWPTATFIMQQNSPTIAYRAKGIANVTGSRTLKVDKVYPIDQEGVFSRSDLQATINQNGHMQ